MFTALLLLVVLAAAYWTWRSRELFYLSVRRGRVLVVRGRVPGGFLHETAETVKSPMVTRARIRGVRGDYGAKLVFGGALDEGRQQRLRNVFALYPAAQLRAADPIKRPTLGQLLGWAWLAWRLDRR